MLRRVVRDFRAKAPLASATLAAAVLLGGVTGTQDVVANGDTRTIAIVHERTKESAAVTFRRGGRYDTEALRQLNWLLRDWRTDEQVQMDPKLFDIVWQVHREVGASEPVHVVSAYRSPETNAALRRRSRAVAEYSQHMRGKAMDFFIPDANMRRVREIGMRLQQGGVGFYPHSRHSFVHLDAGSVRSWPRMTAGELARLFPDGRTVHMPKHGKPLPGYEEAKAMILARGGSVPGLAEPEGGEESGPRRSLWATLFGGGEDEDSDFYRSAAAGGRAAAPSRVAASQGGNSDDAGTRGLFGGLFQTAAPAGLPAEPAPASAAAPEPTASQSGPLPPRRPREAAPAAIASAVAATRDAPAAAPIQVIPPPSAEAAAARRLQASLEDRAALRGLFEAAASRSPAVPEGPVNRVRARPAPVATPLLEAGPAPVRSAFSAAALDAPAANAFAGPAVAPPSTYR